LRTISTGKPAESEAQGVYGVEKSENVINLRNQTISDRPAKRSVEKNYDCVRQKKRPVLSYGTMNFYLNVLLSYCVCYYCTRTYIHIKFFNGNPIKFLCVLKFCVLSINVSLLFAGTIILIPRLHDEAGSTSWLVERSSSARRASSSSQLHRVNGV